MKEITIIRTEAITFFKVIVVKIGLLESQIVDERHFKTKEEATQFQAQMTLNHNNIMCMTCMYTI